jgi:mRNA-degrading endonuclease RelE of RelBE toxin-antitoxin system
MYNIYISSKALKSLNKIEKKLNIQIISSIIQSAKDPLKYLIQLTNSKIGN